MERLVLFAKAPRLHLVKTRLAPRLTPEQALGLHAAMLEDQIGFVRSIRDAGRTVELCFDGGYDGETLGLPLTSQGEGDLGIRMHRALARAFGDGAERAAIIGSDAPALPGRLVDEAFARLAGGADAVVVPAEDGGYVLVGASRPVPALFAGVPWGTPAVLEITRRLARDASLALAETESWPDVDVAADLPRLASDLAADRTRAPATLAFLRGLGL